MASARKKSAGNKAAKKAKPAPKAKPAKSAAKAKPAPKKPAPKPVKAARPVPAKAAKAAPAKPAPKPMAKPAAKAAPAKAAPVKGAPAKAGPVKGAPAKGAPAKGAPAKVVAKPAPPVKAKPPKLVPVTAEAKAKAVAALAQKPTKGKGAARPVAEVRPLGVLPPSAQAKPRAVAPVRPAVPARPAVAPPKGSPKPQPARKGDDRLTPDDLKYFEQRLLGERARITREIGHIESTLLKVNPRDAAGELSGYSYHMADAGTDSMEREKAFDIASKEGRLLLEIDDALRRVYNGTYGVCEVSGKPISRARLEALPWARLSLEEQEKLEKEQRAGRLATPPTE